MSGKGSAPRPIPDRKSYEDNWERTFGKKPPEPRRDAEPDPTDE